VADLLEVITLVEVQNNFDETRLTALQVEWVRDDPFIKSELIRGTVFFDDLECIGLAFIPLSETLNRIGDTIFASAVIVQNENTEWYVATSTESVPFVVNSTLESGRVCAPRVPEANRQGVPVDLIEVNIYDRFPLPFSLELR